MKKGVQMYTVREQVGDRASLKSSLDKIKAIGYEAIQGGVPSYMTAREFVTMTSDAGLENCSSGASYEKLIADPAAVKAAIEVANIFGVDQIGLETLPEDMRECEDGYRQYAAGINKLAAVFKSEGKKLLYHAHALEFFSLGGGRKGMDILVEETDPEGFFFCMDTHWLTAGGVDVAEWILKAKGRMTIVHFKDYAIVKNRDRIEAVNRQFAEVGEGNINWKTVIDACNRVNAEFAIVEQDVCPNDPFESLAISYKNMVGFGV